MQRQDIPKERSVTTAQQRTQDLPKQTLLPPTMPTTSQKFTGKGHYDKIHSQRKKRKATFPSY